MASGSCPPRVVFGSKPRLPRPGAYRPPPMAGDVPLDVRCQRLMRDSARFERPRLSNHSLFSTSFNDHFASVHRDFIGGHRTTWPADLKPCCALAQRHHLGHGIMGPVAGTGVNFPCGTERTSLLKPKHGTHCIPVASRCRKPNSQPRLRGRVAIQLSSGAILGYDEIHASVAIKISDRRTTLLTVDQQPALLTKHGLEPSPAITVQQQPTTRIMPWNVLLGRKKILAQEQILSTVAIEILSAYRERRSHLRLDRQDPHLEMITAIQENRGLQPRRGQSLRRRPLVAQHPCTEARPNAMCDENFARRKGIERARKSSCRSGTSAFKVAS